MNCPKAQIDVVARVAEVGRQMRHLESARRRGRILEQRPVMCKGRTRKGGVILRRQPPVSMFPAPFVRLAGGLGIGRGAMPPPWPCRSSRRRFTASAELFTIHVQVVAARGGTMPPLTIEQFEVSMGGRPRVVRFAELVRIDDGRAEGAATRPAAKSELIAEDGFFQPFPEPAVGAVPARHRGATAAPRPGRQREGAAPVPSACADGCGAPRRLRSQPVSPAP